MAVEAKSSELHMSICDNGKGFDASDTKVAEGHYGFKTMRERVGSMAGSIWFDSRSERGTTVHVRLPRIEFVSAGDGPEREPMVAE